MNHRVKYLTKKLSQSFDGTPWYGESVIKIIDRIDHQVANDLPNGVNNSIARLIQHMTNWRTYAIEKLNGNGDFTIEINGEFDWPSVLINSEYEWTQLVDDLKKSQVGLLSILENKDDVSLRIMVPNSDYNFQFLIEGIIRHDVYHLGQISLLSKIINARNNE